MNEIEQTTPQSTDDHNHSDSQSEFLWYFSKERIRIYAFIHSLIQNSFDAEDVFQQTSMTLWKKFSEYDPNRDFYTWACGVAYHNVKNFRRLAVNRKFLVSDELIHQLFQEQIEATQDSRYKLELLDECITHLKEKDRDIISKVYRQEISVEEVAEALERSKQTIYNRLNLIRQRLMECMNQKFALRS